MTYVKQKFQDDMFLEPEHLNHIEDGIATLEISKANQEDVDNIQSNLLNAIDRAIVEMLFQGVGGESLRELTFMDVSNVDRTNLMLYFKTGKQISVTDGICDMLAA